MKKSAAKKDSAIPMLRPTPLTWAYVAFALAVLLSLLSFLTQH